MKKQERKRYFQHILGVGVYENSLRPMFFQKAGHRGEKNIVYAQGKKEYRLRLVGFMLDDRMDREWIANG